MKRLESFTNSKLELKNIRPEFFLHNVSAVIRVINLKSEIKKMEDRGYQFDAAEGSLSLLIKKQTGAFWPVKFMGAD